ncbi:MAG: hypothetical protein H0U02_00410 [Rubrobacter sp.]|nr:hypothetical protein [Rubrobacter sp.]
MRTTITRIARKKMAEIATAASYDLNLFALLTADEEGSGIEGTHDPEPTTVSIAVKLRSNGVSALDECVENKEESPAFAGPLGARSAGLEPATS